MPEPGPARRGKAEAGRGFDGEAPSGRLGRQPDTGVHEQGDLRDRPRLPGAGGQLIRELRIGSMARFRPALPKTKFLFLDVRVFSSVPTIRRSAGGGPWPN